MRGSKQIAHLRRNINLQLPNTDEKIFLNRVERASFFVFNYLTMAPLNGQRSVLAVRYSGRGSTHRMLLSS